MTKKNILLLIPIYNEQDQIEISVRKLQKYTMDSLSNYDVKLCVVDNASKDKSTEICKKLENEISNFIYMRLEEKGRGLALKHAWLNSDFDFSIYMDADLSTSLEHIQESIEAFENGADITIGNRRSKYSKVIGRNNKRILTSWGYVTIVKMLTGSKLSDFQCGFKGVSNKIAKGLVPFVQNREWFFDTELLLNAEKLGFNIQEIPVNWVEDSGSTVKVVQDSKKMFLALLNYLRNPSFVDFLNNHEVDRKVDSKFQNFQILLFLFVGGSSFILEWIIFIITRKYLFFESSYTFSNFIVPGLAISAGIGYFISAIYNFSLNKLLTFGTENKYTFYELVKFTIVVMFTIWILQPIILYLLVGLLKFDEIAAIFLKAVILLISNFIAHKFFTFSNK